MPSFYSQHLAKTLRERLDGLMDQPHQEMLTLFEELALVRATACETVRMASMVLDTPKVTIEGKQLALAAIRDACNSVSEMVEKLVKVESSMGDQVSINVIDLYVKQITRAVYRACGPENEAVAHRIKAEVEKITYSGAGKSKKVSMQKVVGTSITPDRAVLDMDALTLGTDHNNRNGNGRMNGDSH